MHFDRMILASVPPVARFGWDGLPGIGARAALLLGGVLVFGGCVTIPREAPELSAELGKRLAAIETAHVAMLRSYMDDKRDRVDEFLIREWVPVFAEELMDEPLIRNAWNKVCDEGSAQDRLELLRRLGPRIQARINSKRIELVQPLDELERKIERRLRDHYLEARSINNTLTSFLGSAADVAENRDRFLNMIGVGSDEVADAIDVADEAVADLVEVQNAAIDKRARFTTFKSRIEQALDKL